MDADVCGQEGVVGALQEGKIFFYPLWPIILAADTTVIQWSHIDIIRILIINITTSSDFRRVQIPQIGWRGNVGRGLPFVPWGNGRGGWTRGGDVWYLHVDMVHLVQKWSYCSWGVAVTPRCISPLPPAYGLNHRGANYSNTAQGYFSYFYLSSSAVDMVSSLQL